jgi:hypothetical protein
MEIIDFGFVGSEYLDLNLISGPRKEMVEIEF